MKLIAITFLFIVAIANAKKNNYNGSEKVLKRFRLTIRIIANQVEKGYFFTVYPAYYFSLIDGVGFYRIVLYNHTNTAIAIQELDYRLQNTKQE